MNSVGLCRGCCVVILLSLFGWCCTAGASDEKVLLRGEIRDALSNAPIAARLYMHDADGRAFFAESADRAGTVVVFDRQRGDRSVERHTSLSAHPFQAKVPPGKYTVTVERGKEYLPETKTVEIGDRPQKLEFKLRRLLDLNKIGWYSGETHVHRTLEELPTAMLAEDLNVAFPMTYWVKVAGVAPSGGDAALPHESAKLIQVDPTHVIYPRNTEYEIFKVGEKNHTLGAIFALNHQSVLDRGAPPVKPIAEQVHAEGGLLELDKHNWPWSMMLVPIMNVDLYELANNHHWRTEFLFRDFVQYVPEYMGIDRTANGGLSEDAWTEFGFQNYYALLNCGFRLRPTAGSASGVHPVPVGFGRVYVHVDGEFSYQAWLKGLNAGRSFVTTGPLLTMQLDGHDPGHTFQQTERAKKYRLSGLAHSTRKLSKIEVIAAGEVTKTIKPLNQPKPTGGFQSSVDIELDSFRSSWIAVRCYEPTEDGRSRFAHSSPWHIDLERQPLRPKQAEVKYLMQRVQAEIDRNQTVLPPAALNEYRDALARYEQLLKTARP